MAEPLPRETWERLRDAHMERVRPWIEPRRERRDRGMKHPVDDFLFEYYAYRPGRLLQWHPGYGVALLDAEEFLRDQMYERDEQGRVLIGAAALAKRRRLIDGTLRNLNATNGRTPQFACLGLHEWAMVYRLDQEGVRHTAWPLRLSPDEIAEVVEAAPLRCTHFDAFRFYTPPARPLNIISLTRENSIEFDQPGCLHATMDIYRFAISLLPIVSSEMVADAFDLARRIRTLDMQAAPYDLRDLGYEPVRIETSEGRATFIEAQRKFSEEGTALRRRLIDTLSPL